MTTQLDAIRASLSSPRGLLAAYERYGAWLPKLAVLVLTVALAHLCAKLVWALVPRPSNAWQAPPVTVSSQPSQHADLSVIGSADLFGRYEPPKPGAADITKAKETNLNLTLLGVFAWDERLSRALIQPQGAEAKPYAIGDTVVPGVTLQSVLPDRVLLARNGKLESLKLNKGQSDGGPMPSMDDNQDDNGPPDTGDGDDNQAQLGDIRNQLLSDPARASQYIRVMPLNVGGGLNGYRVYPGPNRALFTNTGLRPGDVVTAVNGVQLNDPARALQLLADLAHTNDLNIVVNRGGTSQNIQVNLNQ